MPGWQGRQARRLAVRGRAVRIARPRPPRRAQGGAAAGTADVAGVLPARLSSLTRMKDVLFLCTRRRTRLRATHSRERSPGACVSAGEPANKPGATAVPRRRRMRAPTDARACLASRFGPYRPRRRRSICLRTPRPADTGEPPPPPRHARDRALASAVTTTRRPQQRACQRCRRGRWRHRLARLAPGAVPYPIAGSCRRHRLARRRPNRTAATRPPQPSPAARGRGSRSPRPSPPRSPRRPARDRCSCPRRRSPDRGDRSRGRVRS